MKAKFGITQARPLADYLPTLTIAAKNLSTEMTNHNVQRDGIALPTVEMQLAPV